MLTRRKHMDKQKLISLAKELLAEEHLEKRGEDLQYLKRQYKYLLDRDEDSYYEQQLTDQFTALFLELTKRDAKLLRSSYEEKKNIIAEMKKLLEREDILRANKELDKLSEDFKSAGRCSKEQDDELWAEYKQIRDEFFAKKRTYFEQLDKSNAEKKAKKEEIIAKAKEVCEIKNVKEANEKMNALRNEWKAVGYSGKGDDYLWKEFLKVLDEFQEKKKEYHHEMLQQFEERAAKKEELIKKAKILLANSEFTDEEMGKIKELKAEWKAVGFAGKEKDDDLYKRFNDVLNKYFEEKKFYTL